MVRPVWLRVLGLVSVLVLAFGLAACGEDEIPDGDAGASGDQVTGEAGNPELYCELVAELEEAGAAAFDEVESNKDATDEDYANAERAFVEDNQENLDALVEAGPDEIAEDVRVLIDSIRGRANLGPKVPQKEATAAEQRITAYEEENC